jgi:hypothetical protein
MAIDALNLDALSASDASLLSTLLDACEATQSFIDAKLFRRDHYAQIESLNRLETHGYLIRERVADKELYRVSLMAMVQLTENGAAQAIVVTAEQMWKAFREHYESSLEQPITLKAIADSLELSMEHVTRVYAYMREWWQTPNCFTPADAIYQAVTVREDVLRCLIFADCVQQMRELQAKRIQSPSNGFVDLSLLTIESRAQSAPGIESARKPSWMDKLPPHAQSLMREIYAAMDAGLLALPAMGIRAVIDVVSDDILGTPLRYFHEKLDALREGGHLTPKQFDVLKAVVEVGHAAAHRAHVPDREAVQIMVETLEHVLYSAYVLNGASLALSSKTPPRPGLKKPS